MPSPGLSRRLRALTDELRTALGPAAAVDTGQVGPYRSVSLEPRRPDALAVGWLESASEVVLSAGSGGRWELEPTEPDLDHLEDVVRSVVAGRVVEVLGWRRARLEVTLADGELERSTVRAGLAGLLPVRPGSMTRRTYAPYR